MREVENSYIISPQTEYGKLPGRKVPKVGVVSQARVNFKKVLPIPYAIDPELTRKGVCGNVSKAGRGFDQGYL